MQTLVLSFDAAEQQLLLSAQVRSDLVVALNLTVACRLKLLNLGSAFIQLLLKRFALFLKRLLIVAFASVCSVNLFGKSG